VCGREREREKVGGREEEEELNISLWQGKHVQAPRFYITSYHKTPLAASSLNGPPTNTALVLHLLFPLSPSLFLLLSLLSLSLSLSLSVFSLSLSLVHGI
jgi:hypothetical protein